MNHRVQEFLFGFDASRQIIANVDIIVQWNYNATIFSFCKERVICEIFPDISKAYISDKSKWIRLFWCRQVRISSMLRIFEIRQSAQVSWMQCSSQFQEDAGRKVNSIYRLSSQWQSSIDGFIKIFSEWRKYNDNSIAVAYFAERYRNNQHGLSNSPSWLENEKWTYMRNAEQ
jgi:hypothetical protein